MTTPNALAVTATLDADPVPPAEDPAAPKPGRWYWYAVKGEDGVSARRLVCVTHVGSNYARIDGPEISPTRIHEDKFHDVCVLEPNPEAVIRQRTSQHEATVHELMAEVKALTMRLAVTSAPGLPSGEAGALAIYSGKNVEQYKAALALAEKKTLPDLFKRIKLENELLGVWLSAPIIPLKAQAEALNPAIDAVRERVFSVELYAGLVEQVVQITDGEPAGATEKLHMFQRRAYMDEECLAQYETGGMEFKNMEAFDAWLARPTNLQRLLPFPRCLLAFQVRRNRKDREIRSLYDYFRVMNLEALDKLTFLYVRNGQQLFRLSTEIEFGADLFPDLTEDQLSGVLYARAHHDTVHKLIPERQWLDLRERERRWEKARDEREAAVKKMGRAKAAAYIKDHPLPDEDFFRWHSDSYKSYKPFDRTNVFYDDISKHIHDEMTRHNRLVLIIQGLLDRSPVLHPHPPWQLWTSEGFASALELHYDDKRALTPGEAPDFQAYRDRLNALITVGTVTLGQRLVWQLRKKETPHTDHGPDKFSRVAAFSKKAGRATFRWTRERASRANWNDDEETKNKGGVPCRIDVKVRRLFNVDAYKPGDFKMFFSDPRTRANYLQWAPLLLEAEEYHAGNRGEVPAPLAAPPKRQRLPGGSYEYWKRKRLQEMLGHAARLRHPITTKGGTKYEKGSLWRIMSLYRGTFSIGGITPDGANEPLTPDANHGGLSSRYVRGVDAHELEIDDSIPVDPECVYKRRKPRRKDDDDDGE